MSWLVGIYFVVVIWNIEPGEPSLHLSASLSVLSSGSFKEPSLPQKMRPSAPTWRGRHILYPKLHCLGILKPPVVDLLWFGKLILRPCLTVLIRHRPPFPPSLPLFKILLNLESLAQSISPATLQKTKFLLPLEKCHFIL